MIGLIFRGRPAWIASMIFGLILIIVGVAVSTYSWLSIVGGVFFVFGLVMLIISLATKGVSD